MKSKSGKNKKIGARGVAGCVTGVRTTFFFTIYYFTDPPQHKIYLFCVIKKGKSCLSLTDRKEEPVKNHISFNLSHN